ncbi:MAG TPA: molybdenum ABC transporter ATP-binding protein [Alphaproteobacteria bacterium]|nr:molybdenum ABC transporter ATP-binding protein [Alphaproteobacteria bacterium]
MLEVRAKRQFSTFTLDVEFVATASGITTLFGRSGSGKTLTVNALAGLVRPTEGRIAVDGTVLFDARLGIDLPPEKRRLGYVFQDGRLFPHMNVRHNLAYGMKRRVDENGIDFDHVVALLGLESFLERRPRELSGGEKQRVAIGRALLAAPRLLLMDEPLASLDTARKAEILPYIERLRDELSLPVVYVSHAMDEIVRLADTVVLMSDGRVIAVGPVESVMSRLDLRPMTGRYEAGAVLNTTVESHDGNFALTTLAFAGGRLLVPHIEAPVGGRIRVRVRARDVSIALTPPKGLSILNVFPGKIVEVGEDDGPQIDLLLDVGAPLWARVTRRSYSELGLGVGKSVHALVKAVAIDRHSLGRGSRWRFREDHGGGI